MVSVGYIVILRIWLISMKQPCGMILSTEENSKENNI